MEGRTLHRLIPPSSNPGRSPEAAPCSPLPLLATDGRPVKNGADMLLTGLVAGLALVSILVLVALSCICLHLAGRDVWPQSQALPVRR
jgi:hypothetical protein